MQLKEIYLGNCVYFITSELVIISQVTRILGLSGKKKRLNQYPRLSNDKKGGNILVHMDMTSKYIVYVKFRKIKE